jgi:hypothetical protein
MKLIFQISLLVALATGMNYTAHAQRGERHRESSGGGRSSSFAQRPAPVRTFQQPQSRNASRDYRPSPQRNSPVFTARDRTPNYARQGNTVTYNPAAYRRSYSGNSISRTYRYSNYYYNNNYRGGYGHRISFMYGPRYSYIPRNSISIYFGGVPYYYSSGFYYGYYGGYYQPIFPPFGLRVTVLPLGFSTFYLGPDPYYYYNGIYYRPYNDDSYEVVDAPLGATIYSLPKGAKSVVINGEKMYELNGSYYKPGLDSKGNVIYTVVGKNGEVNTDNADSENSPNQSTAPLSIGTIVNQLPEGSKTVTINGEKLYVSPDGTYLREETNNGVVQYEVVGN